jgi:asparagine synthase (glutamine-hydrolysing)
MCGIVGCLSFRQSAFEVTEPYLVRMRDTMIHRGPDGEGSWVAPDRKVGFGFRRLAIIDLSESANQPMCNEDGSIWMVFNGEIYNHAEIRRELDAIGGHDWKTDHSDSEVILHAFEQWGIDCLHRFRGMFAIAIWDGRRDELWLIRDRIGIKPLYYSVHDHRIVFASEIKALLEDPDQKRAINEEGFFHFLSFLTVPAPNTLFEGIHKLPPGSWMRIRPDGDVVHHRYWDVLDHVQSLEGHSEDAIAEGLLEELRTAVKIRKVSDVPVGVFLSGGIDSSTNAALFSEGESGGIRTFSIGYEGEYDSYRNELHYARSVAKTVGAEHHEKLLTIDDLIDFLPRMVHLQDEPLADPVCFPVYYVSKLARDHGVVVCQVGEGADELFWGYPHWKSVLRAQRLSDLVPRVARKIAVGAIEALDIETGWRFEYLKRTSLGLPIYWGAESYTSAQKFALLSPRMREQFGNRSSWEALEPTRRRFEAKSHDREHLDWMTYLDLNVRLPELLLMRVDKMSMGVSLEARVPFLDHEFVTFAMGIPAALKTRNGILKYILKKAVRGVIPDEIIDRRKQGFGAPIRDWFDQGLGDVALEQLRGFCEHTDLLDWTAVEELLRSERRSLAWPLLNVAQWWSAYIR